LRPGRTHKGRPFFGLHAFGLELQFAHGWSVPCTPSGTPCWGQTFEWGRRCSVDRPIDNVTKLLFFLIVKGGTQ